MKSLKYARNLAVFYVLYFVVYNTWFGWNLKPQSQAEIWCDYIRDAWVLVILFFMLEPLTKLYIASIKKYEKKKKLKNLESFMKSLLQKLLIKIECLLGSHEWTTDFIERGNKPSMDLRNKSSQEILAAFHSDVKMYCKHCKQESEVSKRYQKKHIV